MVGARGASALHRAKKLVGRDQEQRVLEALLSALRAGKSQALVVHGQPGVGKTALLGYLSEHARDCQLVAIAGIEAEMELPFAALHQLCAPMLGHVGRLPAPQREALKVTFGVTTGPVPDRLILGLGVLGLMSEVAVERPLVCLVDDAQWLDQASAQIVAFVARRLGAEAVAIVIGTRTLSPEVAGLPELAVDGLADKDARALLSSVLTVQVDERVLDRLVAETHGNPLAVLELPRGLSAAELAGGFASPARAELAGSIEESFRQRVERLPADTQRLLLVAAADPLGDPLLLWRAAENLGISAAAAQSAIDDDLVSIDNRVRFRHPLVRSAIYRSASTPAKQEAHFALAQVTDANMDPERRVWHRAQAAAGPDEELASELERSAGNAQSRGGLAGAAAFLERAVALSSDPKKRAKRALAAGQAKVQAGVYGAAIELLALAEAGPLTDLDRAKVDLVRAQLAFVTYQGSDAPPLLLKAARRFETIDAKLARTTYLDALMAASMAGPAADPEADTAAIARAAGSAPRAVQASGPTELMLDGLVTKINDGYGAGLSVLRAALRADRSGMPVGEELRWLSLASRVAMDIWDDQQALALSARSVELAREVGSLSEMTLAINDRALLLLLSGDLRGALSAAEEAYATAEAIQSSIVPWGPMGIAAWRADEEEASALIAKAAGNSAALGAGSSSAGADWAAAVLNNGLGRFREALVAAQRSVEATHHRVMGLSNWAMMELVEAAARTGMTHLAADAHVELSEMAQASGTEWCLGADALARALASDERTAEELYREATEYLGKSLMSAVLGRAHLLYGEWLRRQSRRADARAQLHIAVEILETDGLEGFAERARRELRATGETARKRRIDTRAQLTTQESQVARLARDGLTNPEIATRLYISARTVQYHLSKVFAKLDITSRSQLDRVLE